MSSPRKRNITPSAELPPQSRRRGNNSSDESSASVLSKISPESTDTSISSHHGQGNMKPLDVIEEDSSEPPAEYTTYFEGLRRDIKLVARGDRPFPPRPLVEDPYGADDEVPAIKKVFPLKGHPIAQKLKDGLRATIEELLPETWISYDFVRLGYDDKPSTNPAVILITVEKNSVSFKEGKKSIRLIEEACAQVSIFDIEPEIIEGDHCDSTQKPEGVVLPFIQPLIPLVGSSIALSKNHTTIQVGVGSLGGYVLVDGKKFALTNHHVCFGTQRLDAYPNESEKASGMKYKIEQPAVLDLDTTILEMYESLEECKMYYGQAPIDPANQFHPFNILKNQIEAMEKWRTEDRTLGEVYRSSGRHPLEGMPRWRMDWALVELTSSERINDESELVNRLQEYTIPNVGYVDKASLLEGVSYKRMDLPKLLKRALTYRESENKRFNANNKAGHKEYILWKQGRTSNSTYGLAAEIESSYKSKCENIKFITDELPVFDIGDRKFSVAGDSGSFVFDTQGYVVGLLWGGLSEKFATYMTPIEAVLEDIKTTCGARDVQLVVREAEQTNIIFERAETSRISQLTGEAFSLEPLSLDEESAFAAPDDD